MEENQKIYACLLKNFCQMEEFAICELKSLLLMFTNDLKSVFKYEIEESQYPKHNHELKKHYFKNYPLIKLNFQNEEQLKIIQQRAVGISYIFEYVTSAENYNDLYSQIKAEQYPQYFNNNNCKHKILVDAINKDYKDFFSQEVADSFLQNFTLQGKTSILDPDFCFFFLEVHNDKKTKEELYLNKKHLLQKYEEVLQKSEKEQDEEEQKQEIQENTENINLEQQFQKHKDGKWENMPEEIKQKFLQKEENKQKYMTETKKEQRQKKIEKNKANKQKTQELAQELKSNPNIIENLKKEINEYNGLKKIYFGFCKILQKQNKRQQKFETQYNLQERSYLGPTSTEIKLAFLMANQGQVDQNSFVYDPFCGSGSLLIPPSHFKSTVFGSDLDSRVIHGHSVGRVNYKSEYVKKNKDKVDNTMPKIMVNFDQYNLQRPEIIRMDCLNTAFQNHEFFDAIICDPPYGIKAMTKKSGKNLSKKDKTSKYETTPEYEEFKNNVKEQFDNKNQEELQKIPRFAPIQHTSVAELVQGLYDLGIKVLKKGGRLVFLYPVKKIDLQKQGWDIIPKDEHDRYILQDFALNDIQGNIQRILVTMIKK